MAPMPRPRFRFRLSTLLWITFAVGVLLLGAWASSGGEPTAKRGSRPLMA